MTIKVKSIRRQLFIKRLLTTLIPQLVTLALFLFFTINIMQTYIESSIYKNSHNILTQTQENMELILDEINTIQLIYDYDPTISSEMKAALNNQLISLTELYLLDVANRFLSASVNAKPYIHSVYIYFKDVDDFFIASNSSSSLAVSMKDYYDLDWLESYRKQYNATDMWVEKRNIKLFPSDPGMEVFSLYRPLIDDEGIIVFNLDPVYVENQLKQLATSNQQSLLVFDADGQIIFDNGFDFTYAEVGELLDYDTDFFSAKLHNTRYVVHKIDSNNYGWRYVSLTPFMDVYKGPIHIIIIAIIAATIAIAFSIYITLKQTKENYKLINNMLTIIEAAENEAPLPPLTPKNKNVYSYISENILKTFIEQKYLMTQLSEKQYKFKTMELLALQSQINPHFLYNTLENIYWKVIHATNGPSDTSTMLENLSDILRYSLSSPEERVTLKQELHHTECYIHLLQIRYEDKFTYDLQIEENILNHKVIKLFLQPFIENAIYHGIKNKDHQCHLRLRAFQRKDHFHIHIIDTGIGLSKDILMDLISSLHETRQSFQHIGVFNTYQRLKLVYGETFNLRILSKEGRGTCITLKIPIPHIGNNQLHIN
ncbi:cache domain-containing sensor histidine kinase [Vallitalea okinawensis]|uniref:cache domain-containing sensor histidine kinase n=1 Tax=Vallitalea okinawensis TaxID=2078660 RepID=UPI000CFDB70F|nr:sensor histidine kinase [Vallitalea okinawensis]